MSCPLSSRCLPSLASPPRIGFLINEGGGSMCDYSLQGIRNRLAEQGETLVVHRFQTGSKGLTSPRYLQPVEKPKTWISALKQLFTVPAEECAVCIPDGAQMRVSGISASIQRRYAVSAEEFVTFRQLSADAATYRD